MPLRKANKDSFRLHMFWSKYSISCILFNIFLYQNLIPKLSIRRYIFCSTMCQMYGYSFLTSPQTSFLNCSINNVYISLNCILYAKTLEELCKHFIIFVLNKCFLCIIVGYWVIEKLQMDVVILISLIQT